MSPSAPGAITEPATASGSWQGFQTLFEHSPMGIAVVQGEELRFTLANAAYHALPGIPVQIHGRTVREVFPDLPEAGIDALLTVLRTGQPTRLQELEAVVGGARGRSWWNVEHVPLHDGGGGVTGVLILALDVTETVVARAQLERSAQLSMWGTEEERRAQEKLRESEERFRATFEQAAVGIAQVALDGSLQRVNSRLCDILGCSRADLLGRTFHDITHPDDINLDVEYAGRLLSGEIDSYSMEKRYIRGDGSTVWANLTASAVRDEEGRPKYYIGVAEDISSRKAAEEALAFMAEASRQLAVSLDADSVLDTLIRLALPRLGDCVVIDLVDESGSAAGSRAKHVDAAKTELMREYRSLYPPGVRNAGTPIATALHLGETIIAHDLPESYVDEVAQDAQQARLLRAFRPRAFAILPLKALGRTVGTIGFCITESDRRYTDADLAAMRELAGRGAIALENALLHGRVREELEAARRARLWTERLQALTAAFVEAQTPEEIARVVTARVRETLGACAGGVFLHDAAANELQVLHADGWPRTHPLVEPWSRFAARPGTPMVDAMLSGSLLCFETLEAVRAHSPVASAVLEAVGYAAYAVVPMEAGGRTVGALNFAFASAHRFAAEERGFLLAVGRHAAQALDRAQLFAAERRARASAEAANRARSQFLSTISHELRTPLTAVIGVTELLETDVLGTTNARQRDYLSRMKSSAWHLVSIIDEILTFSRSEAGKEEVRLAEVDVAEIARSVVAMLSSDAHHRGLTLSLVGAGESIIALTDGGKVRQILTNLVGNALKFTDTGSVEVTAAVAGEVLELRVRDTGEGIPPERLEDIFEPFVQVDGSTTRTRGGAGLGLAICKRLARLLGGDVAAASTPGAGSTFTLVLPLRSS